MGLFSFFPLGGEWRVGEHPVQIAGRVGLYFFPPTAKMFLLRPISTVPHPPAPPAANPPPKPSPPRYFLPKARDSAFPTPRNQTSPNPPKCPPRRSLPPRRTSPWAPLSAMVC